MNKRYKPYMYGVFEDKHMIYTPVKNDFIFKEYIERIQKDSLGYYNTDLFYERPAKTDTLSPIIKEYQMKFLYEMKEILDQNKTQYKIVLGPNYDQKVFSGKDLTTLENVFGSENLYDFTGKNEFTEAISNYYEIYHYKPFVARKLLPLIYD